MNENVSSDTTLWKGAILPSSVVALFLIITMSVVNGRSGLLGALLASVTVIIFFSIHLLVARVSRDLDPMATMALAMFSYFAKRRTPVGAKSCSASSCGGSMRRIIAPVR